MGMVCSRIFWSVCWVCLLSACSGKDSPEVILEEYLRQIEAVTEIDGQPGPSMSLMTYPSRREQTLPIPDIRIGFTDYLKFRDCRLFQLVSQRNSALGKIMPVSQRLVYEIRFLQAIEACRSKLKEKGESGTRLAERFEAIGRRKRDDLFKIFWNATFASPEMQDAFSLAADPLTVGEERAFHESLQAIEYFAHIGSRLQQAVYEIPLDDIESHYQVLHHYRYGGRLTQSVARLVDYLHEVTVSLETALQSRPLCQEGTPRRQARQLRKVFDNQYRRQVGPYLFQIDRQGEDWLKTVERMLQKQQVAIPKAFMDYRQHMLLVDGKNSLWGKFNRAKRRHHEVWRTFLEACGWSSAMVKKP